MALEPRHGRAFATSPRMRDELLPESLGRVGAVKPKNVWMELQPAVFEGKPEADQNHSQLHRTKYSCHLRMISVQDTQTIFRGPDHSEVGTTVSIINICTDFPIWLVVSVFSLFSTS